MNRQEVADALMYISKLMERVQAEKTQLGRAELDEIDSAQLAIEEVALGIKAEEGLSNAGGQWTWLES